MLAVLLSVGCSDLTTTKRAPWALLCGWFPKGTYDMGDADAALRPNEGAAISWLGADPCDVEARPQCWPAGATLQLWARADTTGELGIQQMPCESDQE